MDVSPRSEAHPWFTLHIENYNERWTFDRLDGSYGPHPLLEAAFRKIGVPEDVRLEVAIRSGAPPGASTGTSAAATVALLGALNALENRLTAPADFALAAWSIETEMLGQECGIQDQIASAYGGISYIEMNDYPRAKVESLRPSQGTLWELDRRLMLIFLGKSHSSSRVHEGVIDELTKSGATDKRLENLRTTASRSRDAILSDDLNALGSAMIDNTEFQRQLHPALVNNEVDQIIEMARGHGAVGWKVNGAGGEGGSVTVLCGPEAGSRSDLAADLMSQKNLWQVLPVSLSPDGLRVWSI
jgi:D-glycero-alpha-D-manno-heptose-7-phosphate kinase